MKESIELRINKEYSEKLFSPNEGKNIGSNIKIIELPIQDKKLDQIIEIDSELIKNKGTKFYFGWKIKRIYTKKELDLAKLFLVKIKSVFEPTGEECGTVYDDKDRCNICGSNRIQTSVLKLKKGAIPKKDISVTIGGEVVVSDKFVKYFNENNLKGVNFRRIDTSQNTLKNYFQLFIDSPLLVLSAQTEVGIDPFDYSEKNGDEIYKCPNGCSIGLNLLSEAYVTYNKDIPNYDIFNSKQNIGVKRGLLNPQKLIICSKLFREMVIKEKLSGFDFEVVHITNL